MCKIKHSKQTCETYLRKVKSDGVLRGADAQAVWKEVHKVYDKAKVQKGIETLNIMFDINFISM